MQLLVESRADGRVLIMYGRFLPTYEQIDKTIEVLLEIKADYTPEEIEKHNQHHTPPYLRMPPDIEPKSESKIQTKPKAGYIYVIKSEELYKIGKTKNPDSRILKYSTENPYKIEVMLLAMVSDYDQREIEVLDRFKAKQHHGEWFSLTTDDISEIERLLLQSGALVVQ